MPWIRLIYLELSHNSLLTFVLVSLGAWLVERVANFVLDNLGLPTAQRVIERYWNPQSAVGLLIGIVATVLAVLLYRALIWLFRRIGYQRREIGPQPPVRRGLIVLYGREVTARRAILHHRQRLEFIWFILTKQTKEEFDRLPAHWWGRAIAVQEIVLDPYKPAEASQAVENAVVHAEIHRVPVEELICDITGGTTAMTVGAFATCIRSGVAVQMVPGVFDKQRNAIEPLEPIEIIIATHDN